MIAIAVPLHPTEAMIRAAQDKFPWLSDKAIIIIYQEMVNARPDDGERRT